MLNVYEFTNEVSRIPKLHEIHTELSLERPFWSVTEIGASLHRNSSGECTRCFYLATHPEDAWQGLCLLQDNLQNIELLYIYCRPSIRGNKIAESFFLKSIERLGSQTEHVMLEVRISNLRAQKFYEKIGFKQIGKRSHYYADGEDALTYNWSRPRSLI